VELPELLWEPGGPFTLPVDSGPICLSNVVCPETRRTLVGLPVIQPHWSLWSHKGTGHQPGKPLPYIPKPGCAAQKSNHSIQAAWNTPMNKLPHSASKLEQYITQNLAAIICLIIALFIPSEGLTQSDENHPATDAGNTKVSDSLITRRVESEGKARSNPFVLIPHRTNYFLPITYEKSPNEAPYATFGERLNHVEVKAQISVKVQLARQLFGDNGYLYAAYTQQLHWQAYNPKISSPFRETNHEPEVFLTFLTNSPFLGLNNRLITIGVNHESNGQSGTLSRSWNRVFAQFVLEKNQFYLSFMPWWRIPESKKVNPTDAVGDDNPDIEHYLGHGEITGLYVLGQHRMGFMLRNNLKSDNRGALQLDWSFPIQKRVRGYLQYFYGYGESLIDYDYRSNRLGLGFSIIDWL